MNHGDDLLPVKVIDARGGDGRPEPPSCHSQPVYLAVAMRLAAPPLFLVYLKRGMRLARPALL